MHLNKRRGFQRAQKNGGDIVIRTASPFAMLLALMSVSGCNPVIPESGPAAPETRLEAERRERDALLNGTSIEQRPVQSPNETGPTLSDDQIAYPAPDSTAPGSLVATDPGEPLRATPPAQTPGSTFTADRSRISDENSFDAVSERQTIESDAERRERNREAYVVIEPGDIPVRPGEAGPNIVAYALQTTNPVGTQLYTRFNFSSSERYARRCAAYSSPDQAQIEFLARGGPKRDRLGLDPDGDGFACAWNPTPFRAAIAPSKPTAASNDQGLDPSL